MIAIAIVAIVLATGIEGLRLWRLAKQHERLANIYAEQEDILSSFQHIKELSDEEWIEEKNIDNKDIVFNKFNKYYIEDINYLFKLRREAREYANLANFYANLKRAHQNAAWHPWITLPPDPPAPKPKYDILVPPPPSLTYDRSHSAPLAYPMPATPR
jgi:hypothetical protein